MKIQSITELNKVQFFLLHEINLRRNLPSDKQICPAPRPKREIIDEFFISAYPICEIPDSVRKEIIDWDLQRAQYDFNDRIIIELFVYYKLYKKQDNQYFEIETLLEDNINLVSMYFKVRYEQALEFINIIDEYQKTEKETEIIPLTELNVLLEKTSLALAFANLEVWG